jgi:hypothetical protein
MWMGISIFVGAGAMRLIHAAGLAYVGSTLSGIATFLPALVAVALCLLSWLAARRAWAAFGRDDKGSGAILGALVGIAMAMAFQLLFDQWAIGIS